MKITLIKPNIGRMEHSLYVDEGRMEPLQLGLLAGMTPASVDVRLVDDRMEPIPYGEQTDGVAITVETFTARRAYEIADAYRQRGVKVILGGMHAKLLPQEVQAHCDALVMGDAESVWPQVLADLAADRLQPVYQGMIDLPQDNIYPRRELFEGKGYLPITLLQFSRGCIHGCHFCASSRYFEQTHHCRKIEQVVEEIRRQKRKLLFFVDDNIVANKPMAKALFRALIPLKIKWVSQGSLDMLYDRELMELMVKSGCLGHVMGFESIQESSLAVMNKGVNLQQGFRVYEYEIEELRKWGLQTWAAFTLGHDTDTLDSIKRTQEFAIKNKFCFAAFNILMPYPNTALYGQLEAENRLLYEGKWWLHPEYRFNYAAFQPQNMTPDQLTEACFDCRRNFNSIPSVFSRAFEPRTNMGSLFRLGIYLMYNPLFRKEVFKKQGMRFGVEGGEHR